LCHGLGHLPAGNRCRPHRPHRLCGNTDPGRDQPRRARTIEIDRSYGDGLDGLAGFDYAWLLTWLHKLPEPGRDPPLRQVPFLLRSQQREMGMFAARGPQRINPIGLSLIRLLDVTGLAIRFAGVDLVDGTPVIDLKPYVTRFDRPPGEPRCGWYDRVPISDGSTPAQLAPGRPRPI
jgi:tRNA-Thr(GGU) m(6)t(6)A37 methyltransferase TsaA